MRLEDVVKYKRYIVKENNGFVRGFSGVVVMDIKELENQNMGWQDGFVLVAFNSITKWIHVESLLQEDDSYIPPRDYSLMEMAAIQIWSGVSVGLSINDMVQFANLHRNPWDEEYVYQHFTLFPEKTMKDLNYKSLKYCRAQGFHPEVGLSQVLSQLEVI